MAAVGPKASVLAVPAVQVAAGGLLPPPPPPPPLRNKRQEPFDRQDEGMVGRMTRQLRWAFHLRRTLELTQGHGGASFGAWDLSPQAAIMLDAWGRIAYRNPAAGCLLEPPYGLSTRWGRLIAARTDEQQALERLVRKVQQLGWGTGRVGGTMVLHGLNGHAALRAEVHPLNVATKEFCLGGRRIAAVVFLAPVDPPPTPPEEQDSDSLGNPAAVPPAEAVSARFGLTPAEARLAPMLAQGHGVKQAADMLAISYNTARTRLKVIFDKTDTGRQSALVSRILGVRDRRR